AAARLDRADAGRDARAQDRRARGLGRAARRVDGPPVRGRRRRARARARIPGGRRPVPGGRRRAQRRRRRAARALGGEERGAPMSCRNSVDRWMMEAYSEPWRAYFHEKKRRGELARVRDVWVDVPNVVDRVFTCDPGTCSPKLRRRGQESCCAEFQVELTRR